MPPLALSAQDEQIVASVDPSVGMNAKVFCANVKAELRSLDLATGTVRTVLRAPPGADTQPLTIHGRPVVAIVRPRNNAPTAIDYLDLRAPKAISRLDVLGSTVRLRCRRCLGGRC